MENLFVIFITGLTVGGLTCLAVQGGLLASVIASREEEEVQEGKVRKNAVWPVLLFLTTKFFAYLILGFLLGAFGSAIQLSNTTTALMQLVAGLYMVLVAMNLLEVHPIFRYTVIQPPRFVFKLLRNQSKSKDLFAPALLGVMTVLIPCGTTLAMETLAISTGNPIQGSLIMGVFVLGTSPLFFGLGFITSTLSDTFRAKFLKLAAILVLYLGVTSVNGSLVAIDAPVSLQKIAEVSPIQINLDGETKGEFGGTNATVIDGVQTFDIKVTAGGYFPTYLKVKKDIPVKLNLVSSNAYSCASAFRIPSLGVVKNLNPSGTDFVEFIPQKSGKIAFSCSMGMYSGVIEVI